MPPEIEMHTRATSDCCDDFEPSLETKNALKERILEVAGLSEVFKVLSDETRTRMLYLLSIRELCVCDIAEIMEMSMPAVSHHLRLLKALRLVKYRRIGKQVHYSLGDDHISQLIGVAQSHYEEER
jgi:ArsR family transcriptional regulator, lead/cadmium/zinc/bismuth-responsive transcriptional repressor